MAILQFYLLAFLSVAFAEGSYVFSKQLSFLGGDFNVSYNFNASSDTLEFMVEVNATGWVSFGFAVNAPNNMTNYDVAVGGVFQNGSGYLKVRGKEFFQVTVISCTTETTYTEFKMVTLRCLKMNFNTITVLHVRHPIKSIFLCRSLPKANEKTKLKK